MLQANKEMYLKNNCNVGTIKRFVKKISEFKSNRISCLKKKLEHQNVIK